MSLIVLLALAVLAGLAADLTAGPLRLVLLIGGLGLAALVLILALAGGVTVTVAR